MRVHPIALMFVMLVPTARASAQAPILPSPPSIVTSGEAVIQRAPDRAFVTAAVETRGKKPLEVRQQNAEAMTAVQQAIVAAGIPRDALRTVGYSVRQELDTSGGRSVVRQYVAGNAIEVRIDDVNKIADVLDAAIQSGASRVSNVRFDLRDRANVEREALRMAVADARARADAAAAGAGQTVDRVLRIEDARQGRPMPRVMLDGMSTSGLDLSAAAAATPIQVGEIEIRANVLLTVAIK